MPLPSDALRKAAEMTGIPEEIAILMLFRRLRFSPEGVDEIDRLCDLLAAAERVIDVADKSPSGTLHPGLVAAINEFRKTKERIKDATPR